MGLFSWLFGSKATASQAKRVSSERRPRETNTVDAHQRRNCSFLDPSRDSLFLTIRNPQFHGPARTSEDSRYVIGYRQPSSTPTGKRMGKGQVVLVDWPTDMVVTQLAIMRPTEAAVSDSGAFVVSDGGAEIGLHSVVTAFDKSGTELLTRKYGAIVQTVGISACGRYIGSQTANSDVDGELLEVHDVVERKVLFSINPPTGRAESYRFEVTDRGLEGVLVTCHGGLKNKFYAYDAAGNFLDEDILLNDQIQGGHPYTRLQACRSLFERDPAAKTAERVLAVVDKVLATPAEEEYFATALRLKGEILESQGRPEDAIVVYERALQLNPKIGVKAKLKALQKKNNLAN